MEFPLLFSLHFQETQICTSQIHVIFFFLSLVWQPFPLSGTSFILSLNLCKAKSHKSFISLQKDGIIHGYCRVPSQPKWAWLYFDSRHRFATLGSNLSPSEQPQHSSKVSIPGSVNSPLLCTFWARIQNHFFVFSSDALCLASLL